MGFPYRQNNLFEQSAPTRERDRGEDSREKAGRRPHVGQPAAGEVNPLRARAGRASGPRSRWRGAPTLIHALSGEATYTGVGGQADDREWRGLRPAPVRQARLSPARLNHAATKPRPPDLLTFQEALKLNYYTKSPNLLRLVQRLRE